MQTADVPVDLLATRIFCNASERAVLTRRVNAGKISPRQASPRMRELLAVAEALRAQAVRCGVTRYVKRSLVRPPWLLGEE